MPKAAEPGVCNTFIFQKRKKKKKRKKKTQTQKGPFCPKWAKFDPNSLGFAMLKVPISEMPGNGSVNGPFFLPQKHSEMVKFGVLRAFGFPEKYTEMVNLGF